MPRSLRKRIIDAPTEVRKIAIASDWTNDWRLRIQSQIVDVQEHAKRAPLDITLRHLHYLHQDAYKGIEALTGVLTAIGVTQSDAHRLLYPWAGQIDRVCKRTEGLLSDGDISQAINELDALGKYNEAQARQAIDAMHKAAIGT